MFSLNGSSSPISASLATPTSTYSSPSSTYTPSPTTSANLRGPRPWRAADYTSPTGPVKIQAPKFKATVPAAKWSPSQSQNSTPNQSLSGSPAQNGSNSSFASIPSPENKLSPSSTSSVTVSPNTSIGAHGSEPATATRATSTAMETQSSARWLLGGLRAGPNDAPRNEMSTAAQVMDSDEIQYVEVKIKPGPRSAL